MKNLTQSKFNLLSTSLQYVCENLEFNPMDYLNFDDFNRLDFNNPFWEILEILEDKRVFEIDIIYYKDAMDYLSKNDSSLRDSLNLAIELGWSIENLNSEVLASFLASRNSMDEFLELKEAINDLFSKK